MLMNKTKGNRSPINAETPSQCGNFDDVSESGLLPDVLCSHTKEVTNDE